MPTNYPTALDAFTNPDGATDDLDTAGVNHDDQHADANDAIEALQAKVGVDDSSSTSTLDFKLGVAVVLASDYGYVGDGVADERVAVKAAIDAAKATGGGRVVLTRSTTCHLSKYVFATAAHNVTLVLDGVTIDYPSADLSVVADGTATSDAQARSAFLVSGSDRFTVIGGYFVGSSSEVDITKNIGKAVYATSSASLRLQRVNSFYGGGLLTQDAAANDFGAHVYDCTIYGARNAINIGSDSVISGCRFEQPTTTGYDRIGNNGSSHGVYVYAGRDNVTVANNSFRNIRVDAVKFSGTALPIRNVVVANNTFTDCGAGVLFGDDTSSMPEHVNCLIEGNAFWNCGTNRAGWTQTTAVSILGSKGVVIRSNGFYYNRDTISSLSATTAIKVARHSATASPVESVIIKDNLFVGLIGAGGATGPSLIMPRAISVSNVGENGAGGLAISGNILRSCSGVGVALFRCVTPQVEHNSFQNCVTAVTSEGCRVLICRNNVLAPGANTSSNAQIRTYYDAFPVIAHNVTSGRLLGLPGQSWTISDADGGSTAVDHPLLGVSGRAVPTAALGEIVMAYGHPLAWTDGDTVELAGTTYTYATTITNGATQFNSFATLLALLDGTTGYDAVDYGSPFGVVTRHIRVRRSSASASTFLLRIICANPTAGMSLTNGTGGSPVFTNSLGGQAAGPGSLTVVWSPLAATSAFASLSADNAAANTLVNANGVYPLARSAVDSGVGVVFEHGALAADEQFRYLIA